MPRVIPHADNETEVRRAFQRLNDVVDTSEESIANNASAIATNVINIATNASDISSITIDISDNTAAIVVLQGRSDDKYESTAAVDILDGAPVYCLAGLEKVGVASADSLTKRRVAGLADAAVGIEGTATYLASGRKTLTDWTDIIGSTYLTPSARYFLDSISLGADAVDKFGTLPADTYKWRGAAISGGYMYCGPRSGSSSILKVNLTALTTTTFGAYTDTFVDAILAPNGFIYLIPSSSSYDIVKIDPSDDSQTAIAVSSGAGTWNAGVLVGDFIYFVPDSATYVLKFDTTDHTMSAVATGIGTSGWRSGVLVGTDIYCGPWGSTNGWLKIDTTDDSRSYIASTYNVYSCSGYALAANGKIYGSPYSVDGVVVLDTSDDTLSKFGTFSHTYEKPIIGGNGFIYCPPKSTSAGVLVIDPETHTTDVLPLTTINNAYNGVARDTDGKIFGAPVSETTVLKITPASISGGLTETPPTSIGDSVMEVGYAIDETTMRVNPKFPILL